MTSPKAPPQTMVIDALAPPDGPRVHTLAMRRLASRLRARGLPYVAIAKALGAYQQEELLAGRLAEYWDQWTNSGVSVASVTLVGEGGPDLFSYEGAIGCLSRWVARFDQFPDRLVKVTSPSSIRAAHEQGKFGVLLGLQDTTHFGSDLGRLEQLHAFGVRIVQLTYNSRNLVGDGCTERRPAGLSNFGVEVVRRLNQLGVLVDVSHCSEPTALDAVRSSRRPIAVTHGFARALHDHDRGQSDAVIKAVGREGFIGIVAVPFFLSSAKRPSLDDFVRHVEHVADLVGADHVGIGTDWGGGFPRVLADMIDAQMSDRGFRPEHRMSHRSDLRGFESWGRWPNLAKALLDHNFTAAEVHGMTGGNFLRTLEAITA